MEILRKTFKAYLFVLVLFLLLTFLLATVIDFTGFKEEWSFAGLVVILTVAALLLGFLQGRIIGKKGIIVGATAAIVLLIVILIAADVMLSGDFGTEICNVFYIIPISAGAIGGIIGANNNN